MPKSKIVKEEKEIKKQTNNTSEDTKNLRNSKQLSVSVFSLDGSKQSSALTLPTKIFGATVNEHLLAQALRVYMNNQKAHRSSTKTRSEVEGSTRKVYKQKGTGKARHGAIRAPIYVGGGIALGPKSRKIVLDLPKKMKKIALISALTQKNIAGEILGANNLDKSTGKTKQMASFIKKLDKKSALIVLDKKIDGVSRAVKNLPGVDLLLVDQLNPYEVISHQSVIFTEDSISKLEQKFGGTKDEK